MICAHCNQRCSSNGCDMIDPDGAPHRLTCPVLNKHRKVYTRTLPCDSCRSDTKHTLIHDRHSQLRRCTVCANGEDARPVRPTLPRR
jgi:hypothetical protein